MDDYSRTRTLRGSFEDERLHLLDDFICSNVTKLRQGGCWAVKVEAVGLSIVKYTLQRRNEGERARGARGVYFGNTSVITARDASDPSSVVVKLSFFTVARGARDPAGGNFVPRVSRRLARPAREIQALVFFPPSSIVHAPDCPALPSAYFVIL